MWFNTGSALSNIISTIGLRPGYKLSRGYPDVQVVGGGEVPYQKCGSVP